MTEIITEKIKHLNNKPAKFKHIIYPVPIKKNIQRPYYCCCAIGCRGSGKTFAVVKMLKNAEESGFINPDTGGKTAIRHILFSTTIEGNPIFDTLKYLDEDDKHSDYSEEKLADILEELKEERAYTKHYNEYVSAYKKYEKMTDRQFSRWTDKEAVLLLTSYDFIHYDELEKPKFPDGVITNVILDDVLSSKEAFSSKKCSILNKSILNGRHYGLNVIICSQNLKSITKCIRSNTQVWMLFKSKSMKVILDDLYPEISNLLTEEEFIRVYNFATEDDNSFLTIDEKDNKENRFKKNLDTIIRLK